MKARIVHDVAGTATPLTVEGHKVTVHDLPGRGYLVRALDADGRLIRSVHISLAYSVDLQPDPEETP